MPKKTSSKPPKTAAPKFAVPKKKTSRPAPTKVMRPQVAPHTKTLSNGQPRPKTRRG